MRRAIQALLLATALIAGRRLLARRARRMQRVMVTPGRASEASPAQVAGLIEALARVTRERWWVRLWRGTEPAAAFEIVSGTSPEGASEQRIGIAIPAGEQRLRALRGVLASRYPDAVLTPIDGRDSEALRRWLRAVVVLRKRRTVTAPIAHPGERSLAGDQGYGEAPLDAVLAVMAEARERVLVQIVVTPVPAFLQGLVRRLADMAPRRRERARPAASEQREEHAAAEAVVFRPLLFADIRVGSSSAVVARHVAGAIEGIAEGGENQLRRRRPVLRRRLLVRWMVDAEPDPVPSWSRGVYSSLELAGLWHLPTPYGKGLAIERSSLPRLPAPPEVLKLPDERKALATDLRGTHVGIRSEDFSKGLQVSGMAGGGKTSLLAKVAEARAREPNTAMIILDPKGELAEAAASVIPEWRTVRLLDLARPLFGIELSTPNRDRQAEASIFSQAMVDVSRTEEGESQALLASQRSFRMARGATLALEEEPTFWHTLRWLGPDDDAAEWRAERIARLAGDPEWHAVWDHFARVLPAQLKKSPAQTVMRLEAPYNKLQTLLADDRLAAVLHHPVKISLDSVIQKREILIVAGRVPEHPDVEVLLRFYIQLVHRAILGQQPLPEDERARVAAIFDDAGSLLIPTTARMMEFDRAAGLDMVIAWQHGGQVSPELARALDGLCNSRFYLRSAKEDALEIVDRLNPAHSDRIGSGLGEMHRQRVEVNQLTALPVNHAIAVLQAGTTLSSSFTVQTLPWRRDPERITRIESRMRAEGGYDPEVIAPPPELTGRGENVDVGDVGGEQERGPAQEGRSEPRSGEDERAPDSPAEEARGGGEDEDDDAAAPSSPARRSRSASRSGAREAEIAELGSATDKPPGEGYREVELLRERATSVNWEKAPAEPPDARYNRLNVEKRSVLEALYELRVLSRDQIRREFLMSMSERQVRRELNLLWRRRLVARFELGMRGGRGRGKRIYVLDVAGFELLAEAADHPASGTWRVPELKSPQHVVHDLARNEWLFAFRSLAPRQLVAWRGPRGGKLEVPLVREPRQAPRRLAPADLGENAPLDFGGEEFANLVPDLTLELELTKGGGEKIRTDLLVEIEHGNRDETVRRKALDYDGLLCGWWREHRRYSTIGRPPVVFFVVPDAVRARRLVELLDETLRGHLVGPATTQTREQRSREERPKAERLFLGRRNTFIAVASDISRRTLRAWRVPAEPPELRTAVARNAADRRRLARPQPRPFTLIPTRDLVDPAP